MNLVKTDLNCVSLQNIILPDMSVCPETELYFRAADGDTVYSENEKALTIKNSVTFDTYFNSFAIGKYNKYCNFSSVYLRVKFCGLFVLRVFSVRKCGDRFEEKCIVEREISSESVSSEIIEIHRTATKDSAQLYFTLNAKRQGTFYGGEFGCIADSTKKTSIGVVICTYKREKYILRNLNAIKNYLDNNSFFDEDKIHFYVVDNGQTLSGNEIESNFVSLFYNKNTGGSGGFRRGYIEADNVTKNHTHILFMDDDIVLDCEVLFRVYALLSITKDEYSTLAVGGTMLKLSDMAIQHEAGAIWDGRRIVNIGSGMDMKKRENVFEISYLPKCSYNAWWFYCFPSFWRKKYGDPLPFFIKTDDIEYSLRCADEIAIINGIAVWHEDFESKYDGYQEYYIKRNELILTSVNNQKPYALFQVRKLILCVMKQVFYQRYFLADLVLRAYDDYLLGSEHFLATDPEKLNKELMSYCPKMLTDDELREQYGVYFDSEKYAQSLTDTDNLKKQLLCLNGYILPSFLYKKDKDGFAVCDLAQCKFKNFYKHKRVLHYDTKNHKGYVTVQKRSKLLKYSFLLLSKSLKFLIKYPKIRKQFKKMRNS